MLSYLEKCEHGSESTVWEQPEGYRNAETAMSFDKIEGFRRLLERLPVHHPKHAVIAEKLGKAEAGIRGEDWLVNKLEEVEPLAEFEVMAGVSLTVDETPFQMDCLVLAANCALLLESKNIRGRLSFDEKTGEFTREEDGIVTVMPNPVWQLKKNLRLLNEWLARHQFAVPIAGAVVMTSPKALLLNVPHNCRVIKLQQVPDTVLELLKAAPVKSAEGNPDRLSIALKAANQSFIHNRLCERFSIPFSDLRRGVYCPSCRTLSVKRDRRSWRCAKCGHADARLHEDAVHEYVSFTDEPLTNRRLREFWGLESRDVAYRVLKSLSSEKRNQNKNREYIVNIQHQNS
ncbi:NERD domain-containing protein [Indiicoccus explosivorum]|uniref:NERD domain-containing protein n=1 Tax=Indiicoccus explosivorum TaxID=1917864 RepID=UPI000B43C256|nr:NERD domain-containing protein [Indiicoccus explosivorum]